MNLKSYIGRLGGRLVLWTACVMFMPAVVHAIGPLPTQLPIADVFVDTGIAGTALYAWSDNGSVEASISSATIPTPPEGLASLYSAYTGSLFGGWGIFSQNIDLSVLPVDYSGFVNGGEIRFWLNCNTNPLSVTVEDHTADPPNHIQGKKFTWNLSSVWQTAYNNTWVQVVLPLSWAGSDFTQGGVSPILYSPFEFNYPTHAAACYVDKVRWVMPDTPNSYSSSRAVIQNPSLNTTFDIALKNADLSSGNPSTFGFSNATSGGPWTLSDQYIQLAVDSLSFDWGVQIYTDNTAADANPRYTGVISTSTGQLPAGLVDANTGQDAIAMAWSIKGSTATVGPTAPPADDPNNIGGNGWQWLYMLDVANPGVALDGSDPYSQVLTPVGVHYASGPTQMGATDTPMRIYLEANFNLAQPTHTYSTNKLTVEFFYL